MKKLLIILMFLNIGVYLKSQDISKELLKNKDITWVAESKAFILFESNENSAYYQESFKPIGLPGNDCTVHTMKLSPEAICEQNFTGFFLSKKINDGISNGTLEAFSKDGKRVTDEMVDAMTVSSDTLIIFDPITSEETIQIVKGKVLYNWYEVNMLCYYDSKKNKMETLLQSIAPIVRVEKVDPKKKYSKIKYYESFVIPMTQSNMSSLDINNEEVIWSKLSKIKNLDISNAKVLKGDTKQTLKTIFHDNIINGKSKAYTPGMGCEKEEINAGDISELKLSSTDTLVTFDPNTFEEQIEIIESEGVDFDDINLLGMNQHWYWDNNKNQLVCDLKSISAYKESFDKEGEFLFSYSLFSVVFD